MFVCFAFVWFGFTLIMFALGCVVFGVCLGFVVLFDGVFVCLRVLGFFGLCCDVLCCVDLLFLIVWRTCLFSLFVLFVCLFDVCCVGIVCLEVLFVVSVLCLF